MSASAAVVETTNHDLQAEQTGLPTLVEAESGQGRRLELVYT